jgi:hypothetical protein
LLPFLLLLLLFSFNIHNEYRIAIDVSTFLHLSGGSPLQGFGGEEKDGDVDLDDMDGFSFYFLLYSFPLLSFVVSFVVLFVLFRFCCFV